MHGSLGEFDESVEDDDDPVARGSFFQSRENGVHGVVQRVVMGPINCFIISYFGVKHGHLGPFLSQKT